MSREALLARLAAIGEAMSRREGALAVLGLGSVGVELERIDAASDIDVWIIVEPGYKGAMRDDIGWLNEVSPIAYSFRHGPGGYNVLFADGIYAEVDVFDMDDLAKLPFAEARIVWKADGVDEAIRLPPKPHQPEPRTLDWLLGEALTNIFVGLGRFYRGEKVTAMRFIQSYATDRVLEMARLIEQQQNVNRRDVFGNERRFEQRYPNVAAELPAMLQGYEKTPESAAAMLDFISRYFSVDPAIRAAILSRLPHRLGGTMREPGQPIDKVVAYITRQQGDQRELLVFRHRDVPEAGVQVPAGTVEVGENYEIALRREVREEAGLTDLGPAHRLGIHNWYNPERQEQHRRHVYHIPSSGLPDAWEGAEGRPGDANHWVFDFYWLPLDGPIDLAAQQGALLDLIDLRELTTEDTEGDEK